MFTCEVITLIDQEFKNRYFSEKVEKDSTFNTQIYIFQFFEDDERDLGKDLYLFTELEMVKVLRKVKSSTTLNTICSVLTKYFDFARECDKLSEVLGLKAIIDKYEIKKNIINVEMFHSYIINRKELYDITYNKIYNKRDSAIFILLYEGLLRDEILNLEYTQVDWENNSIQLANRRIENIPAQSMYILRKAWEDTEYFDNNGNSSGKNPLNHYVEDKYLIKAIDRNSTKRTFQLINRPLRVLQFYINKYKISCHRVNLSGMFDNFRALQANGINLDAEHLRPILNNYGYLNDNRGNFNSYLSNNKSKYRNFITINPPTEDELELYREQKNSELNMGLIKSLVEDDKEENTDFTEDKIANNEQTTGNTWVDDNESIGYQGQLIVKMYLANEYGEQYVKEMNMKDDFDGYDLLLKYNDITEQIEVKTSRNLSAPIHISINQLQVAKVSQDEYFLYIVYNPYLKSGIEPEDEVIKKTKIYKIQNPINFFGINMEVLEKHFFFKNCDFIMEKFKLFIDNEVFKENKPLTFKKGKRH